MRGAAWILAAAALGCSAKKVPHPGDAGAPPVPSDAPVDEASSSIDAGPSSALGFQRNACPEGMVHVTTSFCPEIERKCLDLERDDFNKIGICHAFAHEQRCKTSERPMDFCIDAYEYPNKRGAHPVWMLDWPEAQATCESRGR